MSNLRAAFDHGKAFIPYVACGDPTLAVSEEIVVAMVEAGADAIELGIPFSDPMAEGPVVQAGCARALASGTTTDGVFAMVERLRRRVDVPLVFMTYANVVFSYQATRFADRCAELGVDGVILPDVPFEEKGDFDEVFAERGVDLVSMIAPTSERRIAEIAAAARGFIYCVSSLGVTGVRTSITTDIGAMVRLAKQAADIPVAVGFGISTPEQARRMAELSDGAIVGSAIVKLIGEHGPDAAPIVADYVRAMKAAVASVG